MSLEDSVSSLESIAGFDTAADDVGQLQAHTGGKPLTNAPKRVRKPAIRYDSAASDEEPLVDTTVALTLHSKKTARLQKRQQKKESRRVHSEIKSFLDFPPELLSLVLSFLSPSDLFSLLRLNRDARAYILDNERAIADGVMTYRYWVLRQCFPLPLLLSRVPAYAHPILLSPQWQSRLKIHRNPYQHIRQIDPETVSWNNLNIILDLAHWQPNFENREPLPIIPRGRNPEWNIALLDHHASIVTKAIQSPLAYARILQTHLEVTTRTIIRASKWRKKGEKITTTKPRLYHLTDAEAEEETDSYLERSGPPSYQPIYMRDNYYNLEAWIPNRKWDKEGRRWQYYSKWPKPHENDLDWLVRVGPRMQLGPNHPPTSTTSLAR
ncbi:hypothetical protein LTR10_015593 [Elasticomyces elasticus]|uniref:F-box domain-containing protein n=1 Tax=Exophiala sideris TaxID=1016849 RepID=A0ABR0JL35_9EURO|nr:hypothetical protein LTR10_015593 [Elasticomyces elasticus]KAK5036303.1 hypothetical protein LTS07_002029 [Exophiala sideris]KAK5066686.1 hypothetical protein LTR69_002033 [Exophiala sideris]